MRQIISIAALATIVVCLIWTSQLTGQDTREGLLISIILTIAASVVSWAISAHYSTQSLTAENTKLIDRIGAQSSEKILNQSKQLYSIEQYLDEKQNQLMDNDNDPEAIIYLESTRNMIRLIRSSNNTYLNDWAGVVSDIVKEDILKQRNTQSQLFEDINLIRFISPEKRVELEEKIEKASQDLPSYLVPTTNPKANHASIIDHQILEDNTNRKKGRLKILLTEDSYKGHVVGKFQTPFNTPPQRSSHALQTNPSEGLNINVFAKTGTVHDFHVGLKSYELNVPLRQGIYEVEYTFEQ